MLFKLKLLDKAKCCKILQNCFKEFKTIKVHLSLFQMNYIKFRYLFQLLNLFITIQNIFIWLCLKKWQKALNFIEEFDPRLGP